MSTKDTNPKDLVAVSKIPLWLLSPIAKAHWALAQFAGMCKYGAWNWRISGVRSSVYLSAMQRHIDAYTSGEEVDPIDGTKHLGNIMACAAILLDAEEAGKLNDDRPPSVCIRETYAELEALAPILRAKYEHLEPKHYTIEDTEGQDEAINYYTWTDVQMYVNGQPLADTATINWKSAGPSVEVVDDESDDDPCPSTLPSIKCGAV